MKFVVYEPGRETRALLCEHLCALGFGVAPFGDAHMAFLFLLGRLHEIDGAIVNVGGRGNGAWLLEHLELLEEPPAVVTYCEVEGDGNAIDGSVQVAGGERLGVRGIRVLTPRAADPGSR